MSINWGKSEKEISEDTNTLYSELLNYFLISLNMTNIFQSLIGKWTNSPDKRYPNITLGIKHNTNKFETFFTDSLRCNIYEYYFQTDA